MTILFNAAVSLYNTSFIMRFVYEGYFSVMPYTVISALLSRNNNEMTFTCNKFVIKLVAEIEKMIEYFLFFAKM